MKRINILYIIGQLDIGGAEKQLLQLIQHIDRSKFTPFVCSLSTHNTLLNEFEKVTPRVYVIASKWQRIPKILWIIKKEEINIIYTWLFVANAWGRTAGILFQLVLFRKKLKMIASERGTAERKSNFYFTIDKILARFSDLILINNKAGKLMIQKKSNIPESLIKVVYNGINVQEVHPLITREEVLNELNLSHNVRIIGTVANLTPVKNYNFFLDIAKAVLQKRNNVFFIALGGGSLKDELIAYKEKLGISDKVLFLGQKQNIFDYINIMDIFILTSKTEGCSNAILEAMAMDKPVVVTRVGGNPEIIENGETGFLSSSHNPIEFASYVELLLNDKTFREKIGKNAGRKIMREYILDKVVQKMEIIYQNLIEK